MVVMITESFGCFHCFSQPLTQTPAWPMCQSQLCSTSLPIFSGLEAHEVPPLLHFFSLPIPRELTHHLQMNSTPFTSKCHPINRSAYIFLSLHLTLHLHKTRPRSLGASRYSTDTYIKAFFL